MKRKILALVVAVSLVAVGLVAGCGGTKTGDTGSQTGQKKVVIGFSIYTQSAPYFVEIVNAAKKAAEAKGYQFISVDAQDDANKQLADVEDLLAKGVNLIVMDAKDPVGAVPAVKKAKDAGVPVIEVDSSIDPSAPVVTTIQSNNDENGKLVGQWLADQFKGQPIKAALISGAQGNPVGQSRRDGVFAGTVSGQMKYLGSQIAADKAADYAKQLEDQITKKGNAELQDAKFQIVAQGWGNWGNEGGLKAMEDILVAHPDINVLITENDSMALGAMQAIKEAKKDGKILIVAAADGQKEALKLIKDGQYGATGMNSPSLIGKSAIDTAEKVLGGNTSFDKITYTPPVAITKENVDKYYDQNAGF